MPLFHWSCRRFFVLRYFRWFVNLQNPLTPIYQGGQFPNFENKITSLRNKRIESSNIFPLWILEADFNIYLTVCCRSILLSPSHVVPMSLSLNNLPKRLYDEYPCPPRIYLHSVMVSMVNQEDWALATLDIACISSSFLFFGSVKCLIWLS